MIQTPMGVREMSEEEFLEFKQQQVAEMRTRLFLALVQVVTAKRLGEGEDWQGEEDLPARIAEEADKICMAALERMGMVKRGP